MAKRAAELTANGDGRAQVITLALVLGALEARTPKDAWRHTATSQWSHFVSNADYLRCLADNGYPWPLWSKSSPGPKIPKECIQNSAARGAKCFAAQRPAQPPSLDRHRRSVSSVESESAPTGSEIPRDIRKSVIASQHAFPATKRR